MIISSPSGTAFPTRIMMAVFASASAYGVTFPFFSMALESSGVAGLKIGLNTAMPAFGWLLGSFILPVLQRTLPIPQLLVIALLVAMIAWVGFFLGSDYWVWTALRLFFGGAMGLFFRAVEFGINNSHNTDNTRGRLFGIYSIIFGLGIAFGAAIQPLLDDNIYFLFFTVFLGIAMAIIFSIQWPHYSYALCERQNITTWQFVFKSNPLPLLAGFAYGLIECIPASFLSIYAIRNGFSADIASYTLTAAAIGSIIIPLPLGVFGDSFGLNRGLIFASIGGLIIMILPWCHTYAALFLLVIGIWSGFASALYSIALAKIGNDWNKELLPTANAAFGVSYSMGSLTGPIINGMAIDTLASNGLVVSASITFVCLFLLCLKHKKYTAIRHQISL